MTAAALRFAPLRMHATLRPKTLPHIDPHQIMALFSSPSTLTHFSAGQFIGFTDSSSVVSKLLVLEGRNRWLLWFPLHSIYKGELFSFISVAEIFLIGFTT